MTASDGALAFTAPKPVVQVQGRTFVVLDAEIAKNLGIEEDTSTFEQAIVQEGVLLRLRRRQEAPKK